MFSVVSNIQRGYTYWGVPCCPGRYTGDPGHIVNKKHTVLPWHLSEVPGHKGHFVVSRVCAAEVPFQLVPARYGGLAGLRRHFRFMGDQRLLTTYATKVFAFLDYFGGINFWIRGTVSSVPCLEAT